MTEEPFFSTSDTFFSSNTTSPSSLLLLPFNTSSSSSFPSPSNVSSPYPSDLRLSRLSFAVFFSARVLWSLLSLAGNLLTLVAVARFRFLWTSTNMLVCSLSVADLIAANLTPMAILHQMVLYGKPGYKEVCLVEKTFTIISIRGNFINLLLMSIDRFMYIAWPLRYHALVTPKRTGLVIGIMWAWILIESPLLVAFRQRLTLYMTCKYPVFLPVVARVYFIPQAVICLTITVIMYALIARIALKQSRAVEDFAIAMGNAQASVYRKERKVIKMLSMVLGFYLLSYIPASSIVPILSRYESPLLLKVETFVTAIFWMGIWINPLIYAWQSKDFRRAFITLLPFCKIAAAPESPATMNT